MSIVILHMDIIYMYNTTSNNNKKIHNGCKN